MSNIDSKTRLTGLLGYPIGHTLSPIMQNAAFRDKNINCAYLPLEVKPDNLNAVIKGIKCMGFIGFNVTMPYKMEIIKYLDEIDELANLIGAVNTVIIKNGKLKGYNTDGKGFLRSLEEELNVCVANKNVFILGSGGAARAICMMLAMENTRNIQICNRTYKKAIALSEDINKYVPELSVTIPMEHKKIKEAIREADILINTTSVGTYPEINEIPINPKLLNKKLTVCDVIYNPPKTKLLTEAENTGCKIQSGLGMLIHQGAEAFELWTEEKAPIDIMFKAIK